MLSNSVDLDSFRAPGGLNSRLASWEPKEKSLRWYKSFLLLAVNSSPGAYLEIYDNLWPTQLGSPIEVVGENGRSYNLDYLLSCQEIHFLQTNLKGISSIRSVCEIGAGFGRTCHSVLVSFPEIAEYVIVDFPEMLDLQMRYLSRVLPAETYEKISFESLDKYREQNFDLVIQIDAFQEMDSDVINSYYNRIVNQAANVFIKNPLGKYLPESAGIDLPSGTYIPLDLGRSKSILDIWDYQDVSKHVDQHNLNYRPNSHSICNWEFDRLFPHFVLQFYKREN